MMRSDIRTVRYPNGEIQRVQTVFLDDWKQADFCTPVYSARSFPLLCDLYQNYIIPRCPWIFGQLVLFRLPEDLPISFPMTTSRFGTVADPLSAAAIALRRSVTIIGRRPLFTDRRVRIFWAELEKRNCIRVISGYLPNTTVLPVRNSCGFLSESEPAAALVNSSFFTMDRFDCSSVYDAIGVPLGLQVREGFVLSPPQYDREALLVKRDGSVSVNVPKLTDLALQIGPQQFEPGQNAAVYTRPTFRKSPAQEGTDLVIIGTRVAAVHPGGNTFVPAAGFVLALPGKCSVEPGETVTYHGFEDILFGIQAGNSTIINGIKTESFLSPFYNIRRLWSISYPPSLYPLDYQHDRAPRIALGADADGRPMLVWAEGAGKLRYTPGEDSCGASLSEMAELCCSVGMINGINLDGGGSAQILLEGRRALQISDRNPDNTEAERAIPAGILFR